MEKMSNIDIYLDELFPNPKCELNYNKDYELLIAIVLSAQSTDKRVNTVTPILFNKYNGLKALKKALCESEGMSIEDKISAINEVKQALKKISN